MGFIDNLFTVPGKQEDPGDWASFWPAGLGQLFARIAEADQVGFRWSSEMPRLP